MKSKWVRVYGVVNKMLLTGTEDEPLLLTKLEATRGRTRAKLWRVI